jgi:Glyoxalase-like domain
MMAQLRDLVIDCRHPASLARFWAAALDGYQIAPYNEDELARLRAMGVNDPEDDPNVLVEPLDTTRPRLFLQAVPEPKVAKNRMHVDLAADDLGRERQRLIGLGATPIAERDGFVVLADPEGNEFCLSRSPTPTPSDDEAIG